MTCLNDKSVTMDKITPDLHTVVCQDILNNMSNYLPMSHMTVLDGHLAEASIAEAHILKSRFDSMPEEQFPILTTKLANVAVDKFSSYLRVAVIEPDHAYFPNKFSPNHDEAQVEHESDKTTTLLSSGKDDIDTDLSPTVAAAGNIYGEEECAEEEEQTNHRDAHLAVCHDIGEKQTDDAYSDVKERA